MVLTYDAYNEAVAESSSVREEIERLKKQMDDYFKSLKK